MLKPMIHKENRPYAENQRFMRDFKCCKVLTANANGKNHCNLKSWQYGSISLKVMKHSKKISPSRYFWHVYRCI